MFFVYFGGKTTTNIPVERMHSLPFSAQFLDNWV